MERKKRGFTIIELVTALVIGSVLVSIALSSIGSARGRFAVRGARQTFATMHARARAQAIERGTRVTLLIDPAGDSVTLVRGTTRLESVRFAGEQKVDVSTSSGGLLRLCMNARGFADTSCGNISSPVRVTFRQNADTASVRILPLGQLH